MVNLTIIGDEDIHFERLKYSMSGPHCRDPLLQLGNSLKPYVVGLNYAYQGTRKGMEKFKWG